jgi:carbon-monoxide dehydrogenase large subunit
VRAPRGRLIGSPVRRIEDARLLRGVGRYVADLAPRDALHLAILRSPHSHATLRRVSLDTAGALPGVVAALCGADLAEVLRPIPMRLTPLDDLERALQLPLAVDRVRYVGEPVAVVVAESRYVAEDALELIEVDCEPLRPVVDAGEALATDAPVLHPAVGRNQVALLETDIGDAGGAFAAADLVVEADFEVNRHAAVPLETRGLVARWDAASGRLTVWGPTKVPHFNRSVLASLLDLEEAAIRFLEPEVGGGFGGRGEFYPEDLLVPLLARRLCRAVAWQEDRLEHLRACNHSRQQRHRAALALRADGTILGLRDELLCDMGAYVRTHGATVPSLTAAMLPGPYRVRDYRCKARCVLTNKTPTGTYRGPGRFEANFVRERLMDLAAARHGLEPLELRRRNLVQPDEMPYDLGTEALGTPTIYDSGDFGRLLAAAAERFGWQALRAEQRRAAEDGRLVGLGAGYFVEKSGLGPWEYARIELESDGRFTLYSGLSSVGQGMETVLAQVCGEQLGVQPESVDVVHGDTDRVPRGGGAFASRGTVMAGCAAHLAAIALARRLREAAARRLEVDPADIELADGRAEVRGTSTRSLPLAALAGGADDETPVEEAVFEVSHMAYPYGLHLAQVEVDPETGQVEILKYLVAYDVGRAVNPLLVEGQLAGGLAQGIGGALLEAFTYDPEGQPLAGSFMDYLLPTALDVPDAELLVTEEAPSPLNPLGVKGAGEGGAVGAGAALANAVADALRPLGVSITALPLDPCSLRAAIRAAPGRASS